MIKVTPFILTLGTDEYLELINAPFNYNMLSDVDEESTPQLFEGWVSSFNGELKKFTKDDIILEFKENQLEIRKRGSAQRFSYPETINEFIDIMYLCDIELHWGNWIDQKLEPKDYLPKNNIEDYYANLLMKMGKETELNTEKHGNRP